MKTLLCALLLAGVACAGETTKPPTAVPITGHWIGLVDVQLLDVTLTTDGATVSGSGSLASTSSSTPVTVTGTATTDGVGLTISGTGLADLSFAGQLVSDRLAGVVVGGALTFPTIVALSRAP